MRDQFSSSTQRHSYCSSSNSLSSIFLFCTALSSFSVFLPRRIQKSLEYSRCFIFWFGVALLLDRKLPPSKRSVFFKVPFKVKLLIYREYFIAISHHGSINLPQAPTLLVTARGDPELYPEILPSYRSHYHFMLSFRDARDFDNGVSVDLVRSMQQLMIEDTDVDTPEYHRPFRDSGYADLPCPNFRSAITTIWHNRLYTKIHKAMNLRTIAFSLKMTSRHRNDILKLVDFMLLFFPALEEIMVFVVIDAQPYPVFTWYSGREE